MTPPGDRTSTRKRKLNDDNTAHYAVGASAGFSYYLPRTAQAHLRAARKQLPSTAREIFNGYYSDVMCSKDCAPMSAAELADFVVQFPACVKSYNRFAEDMNDEIDSHDHEGFEPTKFPIVEEEESEAEEEEEEDGGEGEEQEEQGEQGEEEEEEEGETEERKVEDEEDAQEEAGQDAEVSSELNPKKTASKDTKRKQKATAQTHMPNKKIKKEHQSRSDTVPTPDDTSQSSPLSDPPIKLHVPPSPSQSPTRTDHLTSTTPRSDAEKNVEDTGETTELNLGLSGGELPASLPLSGTRSRLNTPRSTRTYISPPPKEAGNIPPSPFSAEDRSASILPLSRASLRTPTSSTRTSPLHGEPDQASSDATPAKGHTPSPLPLQLTPSYPVNVGVPPVTAPAPAPALASILGAPAAPAIPNVDMDMDVDATTTSHTSSHLPQFTSPTRSPHLSSSPPASSFIPHARRPPPGNADTDANEDANSDSGSASWSAGLRAIERFNWDAPGSRVDRGHGLHDMCTEGVAPGGGVFRGSYWDDAGEEKLFGGAVAVLEGEEDKAEELGDLESDIVEEMDWDL